MQKFQNKDHALSDQLQTGEKIKKRATPAGGCSPIAVKTVSKRYKRRGSICAISYAIKKRFPLETFFVQEGRHSSIQEGQSIPERTANKLAVTLSQSKSGIR
ncbi:MAG: hypothetical protein IKM00_10990 [Clostridia bacterium]|nr:hypothetical protein [Clostridia bacterium]